MTTMTRLRELSGTMLPGIKSNLEQDGELIPTVFAVKEDDLKVIGVPFLGDEQKQIACHLLGKALRAGGTQGIMFVSDVFFLENPKSAVRPSESPDRKEAVLIVLLTRDGEAEGRAYPYRREDGEIIWEKEFLFHDVQANLWQSFIHSDAH